MRRLISLCFLFAISLSAHAQYRCQEIKSHGHGAGAIPSIDNSPKSDTVDILHYGIHLDFSTLPQRYLQGHCDITMVPKLNTVSGITLDLLELQVDSIIQNGVALSYTYNNTLLGVSFPNGIGTSDTILLKVYYQGAPQGDASNWGGWHSQSGYYYNLGVGFAANPHTYGRAWFPCFDNFVEKTLYDFYITTVSPLRPYCNGIRQSETVLNTDTILTHWQMTQPIPTYLASVAISNYTELNDTMMAANGILPIQLMAKPQDSLKMYNSFVNLKPTLLSLEAAFGPYHWSKIGYAATTVGAMEHATSIHFPTSLINGTLSGEDILAHELAHHWWGNLLTCETDADMWINEGMAEYSSHLYEEAVYSRERYLNTVQANAYQVLGQAHIRDDGFKSIVGLDHEYVYGMHVYQKGAMVGHNLRAYMGDSLFFYGLETVLTNNMYGNINSVEFRDQLDHATNVSLMNFFDNWVFNPGFPQFAVDSFYVNGNSASVTVGQRLYQAPALYGNVPVGVTFFSASGDTTSRTLIMNGKSMTATYSLPFTPAFALAGYDGVLLSGDTYDEYEIYQNGTLSDKQGKMKITASNVSDSAHLIVMHHWAGSQGKIPAGADYKISNNHYWTVQGIDLNNCDLKGRITFSPASTGLDYDLLQNGADSLVMLYRTDASAAWTLYKHQRKTSVGSSGFIEITDLIAGDYTLANTSQKVGLRERKNKQGSFKMYPNPAKDTVEIKLAEAPSQEFEVQITDMNGREVYRKAYEGNTSEIKLSLTKIKSQLVVVSVNGHSQMLVLD